MAATAEQIAKLQEWRAATAQVERLENFEQLLPGGEKLAHAIDHDVEVVAAIAEEDLATAEAELARYSRPDYARHIKTRTESRLEAKISRSRSIAVYARGILQFRRAGLAAKVGVEAK